VAHIAARYITAVNVFVSLAKHQSRVCTLQCIETGLARESTVDLLVKIACFVKIKKLFLVLKAARLS
jgi:hypothetical protein